MRSKRKFWNNVNKTETCWLWTGYVAFSGYGQWKRDKLAHRVSYEEHFGVKLTAKDHIHHKEICLNKLCVNPEHLEKTTHKEHPDNITVLNKKKTHCKHGHEFTKENTYQVWTGYGFGRMCRTCMYTHAARTNKRRKELNDRKRASERELFRRSNARSDSDSPG
jgi:hypothetical protein